jgi:hypothetical protein
MKGDICIIFCNGGLLTYFDFSIKTFPYPSPHLNPQEKGEKSFLGVFLRASLNPSKLLKNPK